MITSWFLWNPLKKFRDEFSPFDQCTLGQAVGSLADTIDLRECTEEFFLPPKCSRGVLEGHQVLVLQQLLFKMSGDERPSLEVNSTYLKYSSITIRGKAYNSAFKITSKKFIAMTEWKSDIFGEPPTVGQELHYPRSHIRPVKIHHFMKVSFTADAGGAVCTKLFAAVSWYLRHPARDIVHKPVEVWCNDLFEVGGLSSFIPLDCFVSRCAFCVKTIEPHRKHVLMVVPLVE